MLAGTVLLLPLPWCLALLVAAAVHEGCHLLALRLFAGTPLRCSLGAGGAAIASAPLPGYQVLICTLAGPLGGLLLVPLGRWFPRLALCAAVQSAFNLLPIPHLDGGNILRVCLEMILPRERAHKLCRYAEVLMLISIIVSALYFTFILKLGLLPVLAAGTVIIKGRFGKTPCK